jgi:hypothetical protein
VPVPGTALYRRSGKAGGAAYSEIIFSKDQQALDAFESGNVQFGASVSADITAGASASADIDRVRNHHPAMLHADTANFTKTSAER